MTEKELECPRKPLEPVGEKVSDEQREIYAKLLADFERIYKICSDHMSSIFSSEGEEEKSLSAEEYEKELAKYKAAREEYNQRFEGSIETIEMVREKLWRMSEEDKRYEREHPEVEMEYPPEMEDIPDEPFEEFRKRFDEFNKKLQEWNEQFAKSCGKTSYLVERMRIRMQEIGKFKELDDELEERLKSTIVNEK